MRAPARRRRRAAVALCAAGAALVAACTPTAQSAPAGPAERVEVFTWWASGSEKLAFDAVTSAFASQHPDIRFVDAAVGGGAGSTAKDLLWSRLATGQPPDTFQVHGGAGLQDHVRSHDLRPLDDLARELGLGAALAPEIAALVTVDGVTYAVPSNIHRANVLWSNARVLRDAGLDPQGRYATLEEWFAALDMLARAGVTPLVLGTTWTQNHLLEQLLLAHLGPDGYRGLWDGSTDTRSPEVAAALADLQRLLLRTNADRDRLDWQDAASRVADGDAAFVVMGDWALQVFEGAEDVVWAPAPATEGSFSYVVDAFAVPAGAANTGPATDWLRTVASPEAQVAFSRVKGSIPARQDVDTSGLPEYHQVALEAFASDELVPSFAHGSAASHATVAALSAAVARFTAGEIGVAEMQDALAAALG